MSRKPLIPKALSRGPFSTDQAREAGISSRALMGKSWRRLFPRVWVYAGHPMTHADWILAATLSLPEDAQVSHLTRIQILGLGFGPLRPFHFTIARDLHLDSSDIILHRTEVMPALDGVGVSPAAAFIQYCATARLIDAIVVGDWLLRREHLSLIEVAELAQRDAWRPGAGKVFNVLPFLEARSRSTKESETRVLLEFAGLPRPEINHDIVEAGTFLACGDLVYVIWRLVVEYEGRQHAEDIGQFNKDIGRYKKLRRAQWEYEQITQELLRHPREMVRQVHQRLVERGYDGPAPAFGARWASLFAPIRTRPVPQLPIDVRER